MLPPTAQSYIYRNFVLARDLIKYDYFYSRHHIGSIITLHV